MSTEQNKAIRRQAYEAVNQKNLDALDEVIASDVISHSARPGQAPGLEGVKQLFSSLHAAFSEFHIDVEDMIAEYQAYHRRLDEGLAVLMPLRRSQPA